MNLAAAHDAKASRYWHRADVAVRMACVCAARLAQAQDAASPGVCAGVVINEVTAYLVTAAHCLDGKEVAVTVNGRHADVARINRVLDLAVVRFSPKDTSEIPLASVAPVMGQEIAVIGYPFGSRQLGAQVGRVSTALDDEQKSMRVGVDVIAGDSGGACINSAGELVGITVAVQHWGPMHLGIVVPLEAVRDFVKPFLATR
jgi:S1-C subfamily serine protease